MAPHNWFIGFSDKVTVRKKLKKWSFEYHSPNGKVFKKLISIHPDNLNPQTSIKLLEKHTLPWKPEVKTKGYSTSASLIHSLFEPRWFNWSFFYRDEPIFSLHPNGLNDYLFQFPLLKTAFCFSDKTTLRTIKNGFVLEHPQSACAIIGHKPIVTEWLNELWFSQKIKVTTLSVKSTPKEHFIWALVTNGFLQKKQDAKSQPTWDFYNFSFHSRTRNLNFYQSTAQTPKNFPKYLDTFNTVKLGKLISFSERKKIDVLDNVAKRKSWRGHSAIPLEIKDIANLLVPFSKKTYPSAGAKYENHFYVAINNCRDLAPGLYYFDKEKFGLRKVVNSAAGSALLINNAAQSWGIDHGLPQAVLIITTRLWMLQSKYQALSYRLSLLNAGVILGRLDLQCQSLGLAGCVLGTGDSRVFEKICGGNHEFETSIAEFAFGRRRA
jgi:SagB-type dehydrogenase family enzyme